MSGLSETQIRFFEENGYLVIDNLVPEQTLVDLENEYEDRLDRVADMLLAKGSITDTHKGLCFEERYAALLGEYTEIHRFLNISLPLINDNHDPDYFTMHTGPAFFNLLRDPGILDVMESLIGPEIACNPVQQNRMKPPARLLNRQHAEQSNVGTTTWHQDIAALTTDGEESDLVTIWVAITDATKENGCLTTIPKSHLNGNAVHCPGKIVASEMNVPQSVIRDMHGQPVPVNRGGAILFHRRNIHCSLPNRSAHMRWSMDLRYAPIGQPSGRPAYPSWIARSEADPQSVLANWKEWQAQWEEARQAILTGSYTGMIFDDVKWSHHANGPICA